MDRSSQELQVIRGNTGKEMEDTSARRACAALSSEVIWLNRKTSLVKVEDSTEAV